METLATILYGSQNYGLSGPSSDKDYKLIMLPSFEDLYYGCTPSLPQGYTKDHYSAMDIRCWVKLLHKGNVNAIEYLYSTDIETGDWDFLNFLASARKLFSEEHYLAKAEVWPQFYAACQGLCIQSNKRYGYNPKTVSRMKWIYLFLRAIIANDFNVPANFFGMELAPARNLRFVDANKYDMNHLGEVILEDMLAVHEYGKKMQENYHIEADFSELNYKIQKMIKERM